MPYRSAPVACVHVAARTDVGRKRQRNEDTFSIGVIGSGDVLAPDPPDAQSHEVSARLRGHGFVFGVYDGYGGAAPDSLPSTVAARVVHAELCLVPPPPAAALAADLARAMQEAARRVWLLNEPDPEIFCGVATTAVVAALVGRRLEVAHVGDSRAYLYRERQLQRITRDHSLFNDMLDAGHLHPEDEAKFVHRGVITRSFGPSERVEPTSTTLELQAGDRLVLCTDGVTAHLDDPMLGTLLGRATAPDACCRDVVAATYRAGAEDNLTVLVADVGGDMRRRG